MLKRLLTVAIATLAFALSSLAQDRVNTSPDPYRIDDSNIPFGLPYLPTRNEGSKTLSTLQGVDISKKNVILITAGQSNAVNTSPTAYTAANASQISALSIYDGGIYNIGDPEPGCSSVQPGGGNWATVLADKLITDTVADRVIIACTGISGSTVADWGGGGGATTFGYAKQYMSRVPVALARLKAKGITENTTNVTIVVLWEQGETDGPAGTTQVQYVVGFNNWVAAVRAAGFSGRILVAVATYNGGVAYGTIQSAQTVASPSGVINNGAGIYIGANADQLIGSVCSASACRQGDNTHWSDAGRSSVALDATYGWRKALQNTGAPF